MDTRTHPFTRGKRNAEAMIDDDGIHSARAWLLERIADTSKTPLDAQYIKGFEAALKESF